MLDKCLHQGQFIYVMQSCSCYFNLCSLYVFVSIRSAYTSWYDYIYYNINLTVYTMYKRTIEPVERIYNQYGTVGEALPWQKNSEQVIEERTISL